MGLIVVLLFLVLALLALRRFGRKRILLEWLAVDATSIPRDFARLGQPWLGRLAFLGFPVIRVMRSPDLADPESVHWLLSSATDRTIAVFTGSIPQSGGKAVFGLRLLTFLSDGRLLITSDRVITRRPPAHWSLVQRHFETLEAQVQGHRNRVAAEANGALAVLPQVGELPSKVAAEDRAEFEALRGSGDYTDCGPDTLRPALSRLPRLALQDFAALFSGSAFPSGRRKDIASSARTTAPDEEEIAPIGAAMTLSIDQLVERDLLRYRKHANQAPSRKQFFLRLLVLFATLVFFTLTFGREAPAATVGMLLAIIAVHDFGHWLAMKLFGYRGMGRFFVPFFGPIDRGKKLSASPWQQILVILAGPVPGLLAGLAVLTTGFFVPQLPLWVLDLGGLAVLLNAFHLLPFLPLDGGKIVDFLVFRDLPFLRPLFTGVSAAGTLIASFLLRSRAIRLVAVGMFAGLIWDIKMIKVVRGGRRLGWAGSISDEDEALRRIFRGVREEKNDAFFRSSDWQRQIDVLLAEVLRKRPGFLTRFLGCGVYWALCVLPVLGVVGVIALMLVGGLGSLALYQANSEEFHEVFPMKKPEMTEPQFDSIDTLVSSTLASTAGNMVAPEQRAEIAEQALPSIGAPLDQLDWIAAGIAHHGDMITPAVLSVWLEILCSKLEVATREGRLPEATRRAELLLHGIAAMEPALTLAHRELLWDAELRTLAEVEKLSASGGIDATTLQRIEARVTSLNKAPLPEVENLLMVDGWGEAQVELVMSLTGQSEKGGKAMPDTRFWRHAYPHIRRLSESGLSFDRKPATVALARHWKKYRKVGELPAELGEPIFATPEEADFILAFCENHRRIQWRRTVTLSALRLEAYRRKSGRFPDPWKHPLPGGASMQLAFAGTSTVLELTDLRHQANPTSPKWLGGGTAATPAIHHACPLFGAR